MQEPHADGKEHGAERPETRAARVVARFRAPVVALDERRAGRKDGREREEQPADRWPPPVRDPPTTTPAIARLKPAPVPRDRTSGIMPAMNASSGCAAAVGKSTWTAVRWTSGVSFRSENVADAVEAE
jgi:hypothetical protein